MRRILSLRRRASCLPRRHAAASRLDVLPAAQPASPPQCLAGPELQSSSTPSSVPPPFLLGWSFRATPSPGQPEQASLSLRSLALGIPGSGSSPPSAVLPAVPARPLGVHVQPSLQA